MALTLSKIYAFPENYIGDVADALVQNDKEAYESLAKKKQALSYSEYVRSVDALSAEVDALVKSAKRIDPKLTDADLQLARGEVANFDAGKSALSSAAAIDFTYSTSTGKLSSVNGVSILSGTGILQDSGSTTGTKLTSAELTTTTLSEASSEDSNSTDNENQQGDDNQNQQDQDDDNKNQND